MISEIVRSKANIDNGARTRWSDFSHAIFLLLCVGALPLVLMMIPALAADPQVLNHIPLAALAAMLVYTGCRLASPSEFIHAYRVGLEQLAIFLATLITTLKTDLLVGIAAGVATKIAFHILRGASPVAMFMPHITSEDSDERTTVVRIHQAAVFTNWLWLKKAIRTVPADRDVVVDLAATRIVDHTVMEKLHEMERDFHEHQRRFEVAGLEQHRAVSPHPLAARLKGKTVAEPAPMQVELAKDRA
jgi:MFS superfamily sulfate permease-like transporter